MNLEIFNEWQADRILTLGELMDKKNEVEALDDKNVYIVRPCLGTHLVELKAILDRESLLRGILHCTYSVWSDLEKLGMKDIANNIIKEHTLKHE